MSKKKIKFKKRLYNIWTWIKNPVPVLIAVLGLSFMLLVVTEFDPCPSRLNYPIHGACSNGDKFTNPATMFVMMAFVLLPVVLILFSNTENDFSFRFEKNSGWGIVRYFRRWPRWRRKWYPVTFAIIYVIAAAYLYILYRDGGLRWYHYVGQFGIALPFFAGILAGLLVDWARRRFELK